MKVFRDLDDQVVILIRYDGDYYKVILCVIWFLGLLCNGNLEGQFYGIIFMLVLGYKICNWSKLLVLFIFILNLELYMYLVDIKLVVVFFF